MINCKRCKARATDFDPIEGFTCVAHAPEDQTMSGQQLAAIRTIFGDGTNPMTIEQFASLVQRAPRMIQFYEAGETTIPRIVRDRVVQLQEAHDAIQRRKRSST